MKQKIIKWLFSENGFYQALVFILNPILASSFPIVAFVIFMLNNNFFSYDFFTNGVFGLNIFFIVSVLLLILVAFFLAGIVIPLFYYFLKKEHDKIALFLFTIGLLLINGVGLYALYLTTNIDSNYKKLLIIISILINMHIAITLYAKPKHKFFSLIFIGFLFYGFMLINPSQTSDLVELGIEKFNMGGSRDITIKDEKNKPNLLVKGKLLLLTPNRVFIKNNNKVQIIERKNKVIEIFKEDKKKIAPREPILKGG